FGAAPRSRRVGGGRKNGAGPKAPRPAELRGQHELLCAFIVKKMGTGTGHAAKFLGFAWNSRSQSPFFHKQPIQERRRHRARPRRSAYHRAGQLVPPASPAGQSSGCGEGKNKKE